MPPITTFYRLTIVSLYRHLYTKYIWITYNITYKGSLDFGIPGVTATKKRKMTSELTPDNADKVLTSSLDFSKFHIAVSEKAEMTEGEIFALLKLCIIDPNIGDLHLAGLSCCLTFYYCFNGRSSHFQVSERDTSNRLDLTSLMTWTYSNQM